MMFLTSNDNFRQTLRLDEVTSKFKLNNLILHLLKHATCA